MIHSIETIPLKMAFVDRSYSNQRPEIPSHVKYLTENWDGSLAAQPMVSGRKDGSYAILDGQHGIAARRNRGESSVEAKVFYDLTPAEEAYVFVNANRNRKVVNAIWLFNASAAAEEEPALSLSKILSANGWTVGSTAKNGKGKFSAVATLRSVARGRRGLDAATATINTLTYAWGNSSDAAHQTIVAGLGKVFNQRNADPDRMADKLSKADPLALLRSVQQIDGEDRSVTTLMANRLIREYNKNLHGDDNRLVEFGK